MAERLLRVRTRQKSKKPEFNFHDSHKKKKLGTSWRKPRGLHNKLRQHIAMAEIRVNNVAELAAAQGCAVRIASAVGMKKRLDIQAKAAEMGLKILNPKGGA